MHFSAPYPIYFGVAPLSLFLDPLAAIFVLLLLTVTMASAIFAPSYLRHLTGKINQSYFWINMILFIVGMLMVLLSANAVTFLVFWEIMSLSSAALVASDFSSHKAHKATIIYLGATRIATSLLAIGFLWYYSIFSSWNFVDWKLNSESLPAAILVALGLCIKAGIWPFHIWLPYAHPQAPAPVSALMSGVMIKVAIYAAIRLFVLPGSGSEELAYLFIALGMISALWGIVFALIQTDLKRLLAYSSVENIGLILASVGICLWAQKTGMKEIALISFVAALFHSINHGIFKSLLFLSTGAIDSAMHSREMKNLGGLSKKMPWTSFAFLVGAASACALPPLSGFASKWLIYQGFFTIPCQWHGKAMIGISLVSIGLLAFLGGLALACFTKAFAISFLGRPRSAAINHAKEASPSMLIAQLSLTLITVLMGLLSPQIISFFSLVYQSILVPEEAAISGFAKFVGPSLPLLPLAIVLTLLTCIIYYSVLFRKRKQLKLSMTWECGYGGLEPTMQATAGSFSHSIATIFAPILHYSTRFQISGKDRRHFPEQIQVETEISSLLESSIYSPIINSVRLLSGHFSKLQAGSIHLYLLYVFITLIALLTLGAKS
jgi:hydrogenase-4 component B